MGHVVDRIAREIAHEGGTVLKDFQLERGLYSPITIPPLEQDKLEPIRGIRGRADVDFDPGNGKPAIIWEIKLVQSLKLGHVVQTVQ